MGVKMKQKQEGFALLLAITVASVLLALGLTMLTVTTKQLTLSSVARESEIAFQAAAAGMECIRYQRYDSNNNYISEVSGGNAPNINCFSTSDSGSGSLRNLSDGYVNEFDYQFSWGSGQGARCSDLTLFVMVAEDDDITFNFNTLGMEAVGNKTCRVGDVCTVAVAQGFNKSCADVNNGLATVQRELTAQF